MGTAEAYYFTVTVPNGSIVVKRAGKRDYRWAVCRHDSVVGWHVTERGALRNLSQRLRANAADDLSIERVVLT